MSLDLTFSSCEPGEQVSFLVKRYLFLESDAQEGCFCDKHIPEGSCSLVFNFSGDVCMNLDHENRRLPPYFLTVPYLGYVNIRAMPPIDTFGVSCKTSVFSSFFNIGFDNCDIHSFRPIHDVIPEWLWSKLKEANSRKKRIEIFEDFICATAKGKIYQPDSIDIAYEQIYSSNGLLCVNDLVSDINMNSRSFRRNFYRRVGVSAKSLCRIVRTTLVLQIMEKPNEIDFQNIVCSCKFFDQPHLVNDFRKFVGESPGTFFNRDLKMVKILSGL